jgi:hypothetical protein
MADADDKAEDLTLVYLRGIRREVTAILENQLTFAKQIGRLYEHVDRLSDRVEAFATEMRGNFKRVESDIALLEIQNIARHGETLSLLRKLDERDGT